MICYSQHDTMASIFSLISALICDKTQIYLNGWLLYVCTCHSQNWPLSLWTTSNSLSFKKTELVNYRWLLINGRKMLGSQKRQKIKVHNFCHVASYNWYMKVKGKVHTFISHNSLYGELQQKLLTFLWSYYYLNGIMAKNVAHTLYHNRQFQYHYFCVLT